MASETVETLGFSPVLIRFSGLFLAVYAGLRYIEAKRSPINTIPAVGYSGVLTSYITAIQWLWKAGDLIKEGYSRYPGQPFRVATLSRWIVLLSGKQHIDDIRKAPDDVLSFIEATEETTHSKYIFGQRFFDEPFHIATVRSPITRNLISRFDDIRDEIVESFTDYIPPTKDWTPIPAYDTLMHIVCRTSNRYFVGLPLCREPGYRSLNETFTVNLIVRARITNCFPKFLRHFVASYLTTSRRDVAKALHYLGPILEARIAQAKLPESEKGERPNDLISWLIENSTKVHELDARDLALRILAINFAAIHTSTMSMTHALYDLVSHPEYIEEMREEAEAMIEEHGWTKAAMQKMRKIDSFLRESQRFSGLGSMVMTRKTLKDWTLSDGTHLPADSFIAIASDAMHKDESLFPDASSFKGFRFSEMRDGEGELDSIKHQMVSLDFDLIVFGHGRHACPGRFFAVNEIKAMFAHILLEYDVQLENGSLERPPNTHFEAATIPSPRAKTGSHNVSIQVKCRVPGSPNNDGSSTMKPHYVAFPVLVTPQIVFYLSTVTLLVLGYLSFRKSPLDAIPTVGHSWFITSYLTALRWTRHGDEILQEGYNKYAGRPFKVATMSRWVVILSGKKLLDDMKTTPDEVISLRRAVVETMHIEYTLGRKADEDSYHNMTIRSPLTRQMMNKFDEIRDEIVQSFAEYIPLAEDWVTVPAFATVIHIVCRINTRYFIGLPLCRNAGYRLLIEGFTYDVAISTRIINSVPSFMRPWLLDTCTEAKHRTVDDLVMRILNINFASLHTTSMATTQALFDLAIHPEYIMELRQEVEMAISELGWTKAAVQRMHKLDSFLKESQRLNNMGTSTPVPQSLKNPLLTTV
ncbi:hypothetical protein NP233_g11785 [Leucocoprinus birnbaumii]|uniref:Cytochrome P450 n=1 Tax=Leucocoprinus birnbaumii TaxID=56174 RepID=A0AAD5YL08_9AGAR|nr:hypothetical protein NP233_g11785 [Leucocoprinus birnbaumii]